MSDRDEANLDPSVNRLQRAQQSGQMARSRDLAVAVVWLGGIALVATFGHWLWRAMDRFSQSRWGEFDISMSAEQMLNSNWVEVAGVFWSCFFPSLAGIAGFTILTWTAQSGFRAYPGLLAPDIDRLNPVRNLRQIFSAEQVVSVLLAISKLAVLSIVAAWVVLGDLDALMMLGKGRLQEKSPLLMDWLVGTALRLCVAALAVGAADYGVRWWLHRRSLQMTEQEARDEQQASEPSPEIHARRRARQLG